MAPRQYIVEHSGHFWIVTASGAVGVRRALLADEVTMYLCFMYTGGLTLPPGGDLRLDDARRALVRSHLAAGGPLPFGLTEAGGEMLLGISLGSGALRVRDPLAVWGPGADVTPPALPAAARESSPSRAAPCSQCGAAAAGKNRGGVYDGRCSYCRSLARGREERGAAALRRSTASPLKASQMNIEFLSPKREVLVVRDVEME
ncbi:MAG: hypothetical protein WC700_04085 [Gemmatimonadaceae bacterium]|jgi:hypothetical protein